MIWARIGDGLKVTAETSDREPMASFEESERLDDRGKNHKLRYCAGAIGGRPTHSM